MLVETGSQSSVPALLAALDDLGIAADDLAHVVVTHIHLDHAGGVGDVAHAFPRATVHVHEKGARHLVDPTRLVDSAAMVYGDLLDSPLRSSDPHRGGPGPRPGGRRRTGRRPRSGAHDHRLARATPSTTSVCTTRCSGLLFVGDAVGVRLPDAGMLRPATPPPDFDLDQALTSIAKFAARRPTGIALAHYGLVPEAEAVLDEASEILTRWAEVAEAAWQQGEDIAEALDTVFGGDLDGVDPGPQREAGDPERDPLQRRRFPPLARQADGPGSHHHGSGHSHSVPPRRAVPRTENRRDVAVGAAAPRGPRDGDRGSGGGRRPGRGPGHLVGGQHGGPSRRRRPDRPRVHRA